MGKFARALATVHDYSTDYLVDGVKVAGRGIKKGALKVKDATSNAVETLKTEHAAVEAHRAEKREANAAVEEIAQEVVESIRSRAGTARPKATSAKKASPKSTPTPA